MFNFQKTPVEINYFKNNTFENATVINKPFTQTNRDITTDDFELFAKNDINIISLDHADFKSTAFNELFKSTSIDTCQHAIQISHKSNIDIYLSPELTKIISDIVIQSNTLKVYHLDDNYSKMTSIDGIMMKHVLSLTVKDLFRAVLFNTSIHYNARFRQKNHVYVPFLINKVKYKSQYKVINNQIIVYIS